MGDTVPVAHYAIRAGVDRMAAGPAQRGDVQLHFETRRAPDAYLAHRPPLPFGDDRPIEQKRPNFGVGMPSRVSQHDNVHIGLRVGGVTRPGSNQHNAPHVHMIRGPCADRTEDVPDLCTPLFSHCEPGLVSRTNRPRPGTKTVRSRRSRYTCSTASCSRSPRWRPRETGILPRRRGTQRTWLPHIEVPAIRDRPTRRAG